MPEKIYVIGHKSPDLDSVAAAISYANLKNLSLNTQKSQKVLKSLKTRKSLKTEITRKSLKTETTQKITEDAEKVEYIPAAAGEINKVTEYVLEKFGFNEPEILSDANGKNLVLVDHNEISQMVAGADEAKIAEVLDHHKMNFSYPEPIEIKVRPWGSTTSIIYWLYQENDLEIDKNLAGLMLSAALDDTVITKSPTCTDMDREIIEELADLAGIENWQEYGLEMFKVKSSAKDLSAEEIIKFDFKDFQFKAGKFGIGQVETVDLSEFESKEDELMAEMDKLRQAENYHSVVLIITDIMKEGSRFLVSTSDQKKVEVALENKLENKKVYIKGIISRKKQVIPKFTEVFDK